MEHHCYISNIICKIRLSFCGAGHMCDVQCSKYYSANNIFAVWVHPWILKISCQLKFPILPFDSAILWQTQNIYLALSCYVTVKPLPGYFNYYDLWKFHCKLDNSIILMLTATHLNCRWCFSMEGCLATRACLTIAINSLNMPITYHFEFTV